MEAVGGVASILAIAGAGIKISTQLISFADQVGTAPKRIRAIGTDVSVTAGTLQQLGELMKKPPEQYSIGMFRPDQEDYIVSISTRCKEIFDELKIILSKASQQLRDVYKSGPKGSRPPTKIKLSKIEHVKWPFLQRSTDPLLTELRNFKGTLMVILQVVHLRHAQVTASLNGEELRDLVRMIAAMERQQQASLHVENSGYKGLDAGDANDSDTDSEDSSKSSTALEAWSVIPNTFSDDTFRHFSITPVPVSQQQIAKLLPQDVDDVARMIDSLSPPEREAILGGVLDRRLFGPDRCSIRSITAQSWTGSHDLFGKVSGRKFNVIIERKVKTSKSSRTKMRYEAHREARPRPRMHHKSSDPNPPMYDSFSDVDAIQDPIYTRGSSPSPPPRGHRRRRPAAAHPGTPSEGHSDQAAPPPEFNRRRPTSDGESERRQAFAEKKRLEETILRREEEEKAKGKKTRKEGKRKEEEKERKKTSLNTEQRTRQQTVHESSDDQLVKSLLTEYTNFDPGEPLVQGFATPPPAYNDSFVLPQRVPRPY